MKYVYLVEVESEHDYTDLRYDLDNKYWKIFKTLKQAKEYMVKIKDDILKHYAKEIEEENKNKNTFTIDLMRYYIFDNKDFFNDKAVYLSDLWDYEHYLVDSRYLCGRY